jgi:hypothetical protein
MRDGSTTDGIASNWWLIARFDGKQALCFGEDGVRRLIGTNKNASYCLKLTLAGLNGKETSLLTPRKEVMYLLIP